MELSISNDQLFSLPALNKNFSTDIESWTVFAEKVSGRRRKYLNFRLDSETFSLPAIKFLNGYTPLPFTSGLFFANVHFSDLISETIKSERVNLRVIVDELPKDGFKCEAILDLSVFDLDLNDYFSSLKYNVRRQIKLESETSSVLHDVCFEEYFEIFYTYYFQNMLKHRSPCQSRNFFITLKSIFGDKLIMSIVNRPSGVRFFGLSLLIGKTYQVLWTAQNFDSYSRFEPYLFYFSSIAYARSREANCFNFGRSNYGSGSYLFKRHWKPKFYNIRSDSVSFDSRNSSKLRNFLGNEFINFTLSKARIFERFIG